MENGGGGAAFASPLPPQAAHLNAAFQAAAAAASAANHQGSGPGNQGGGGGGAAAVTAPSSSVANSISNFHEALMSRMGRPFGLSTTEMKDLAANSPFAAASLANLGRAGALPAGHPGADSAAAAAGFAALPFLSHMAAAGAAPPGAGAFLHHFVDPRNPFAAAAAAAGAFKPFLTSAASAVSSSPSSGVTTTSSTPSAAGSPPGLSVKSGFPSAFQPPSGAKADRKGSSPPALFSPGQNLFPRSSSVGSPGSPSSSPPMIGSHPLLHHHRGKADENSNTSLEHHRHADSISPVSSMDSNPHAEEERGGSLPKKFRASVTDFDCYCPNCNVPLKRSELEAHYVQELDMLAKHSAAIMLTSGRHLKPHVDTFNQIKQQQLSPRMGNGTVEVAPRSRWDTFQRIQRNRQSRIRVKLSRRAAKRQDEILEEEFEEQPLKKVALAKGEGGGGGEEDIDIVGDANNTSLASSDGASSNATARELQTHVYGPPQFSEADVLACMQDEESKQQTEDEESKAAAAAAAAAGEDGKLEVKKELVEEGDEHLEDEDVDKESEEGGQDEVAADDDDEERERRRRRKKRKRKIKENLESLKAKLRELEENNKCSKCLKTLTNPVVNVGCWHIQCEKCWLVSLGTKKSCSLCGISTAPADLRRVFL